LSPKLKEQSRALISAYSSGFGRTIAFVKAERLHSKEVTMLWTIFVILLVMWLLGMATSYTLGGFIHILLILAIAAVLIRVIQGRTPV
jgi:asparagine N-glycosylation enzyme membrane subunit Stt3